MPQRQLPIFPAGVTEINSRIAIQKQEGQVWYIHGHLPVFHHEEVDVGSFRMLALVNKVVFDVQFIGLLRNEIETWH